MPCRACRSGDIAAAFASADAGGRRESACASSLRQAGGERRNCFSLNFRTRRFLLILHPWEAGKEGQADEEEEEEEEKEEEEEEEEEDEDEDVDEIEIEIEDSEEQEDEWENVGENEDDYDDDKEEEEEDGNSDSWEIVGEMRRGLLCGVTWSRLLAALACLSERAGAIERCFETREINLRGLYKIRLYDGQQEK
eukprot:85137-Hanusia_phi.AAC.1